jgi:hypothetical protein
LAFYITLFCKSGATTAGAALDALLAEVTKRGRGQQISERRVGDGWAGCTLSPIPGIGYEAVTLEIHDDREIVQRTIKDYGDEANAPRIADTDLLVIVTLVEETADWTLVRDIWESVAALWPMVPHNDVSGFDISLDSFPQ